MYDDPRQSYGRSFLRGGGLSGAVRMLLAWNVIMFLLQWLLNDRLRVVVETGGMPVVMGAMNRWLGLSPDLAWNGAIWQLVTYMFLHGGLWHLAINMFILWMFGSEIENLMGTARFVRFYFFSGIGAGLTTLLVNCPFWGSAPSHIPTVGASGAIFGILLAYGMSFPNRKIFLYFLIPIPAKYFVVLLGLLDLFASFSGAPTGIAHFAHLGGLLFGWIYIMLYGIPGVRMGHLERRRRRRRAETFRVIDFNDRDR